MLGKELSYRNAEAVTELHQGGNGGNVGLVEHGVEGGVRDAGLFSEAVVGPGPGLTQIVDTAYYVKVVHLAPSSRRICDYSTRKDGKPSDAKKRYKVLKLKR